MGATSSVYRVPVESCVHISSQRVIIQNVEASTKFHHAKTIGVTYKYKEQCPFHHANGWLKKTMQNHKWLTNFATDLLANHKFWPYLIYLILLCILLYLHIDIPGNPDDHWFDWKGPLLEGWSTKTEDIHWFQVYLNHICLKLRIQTTFIAIGHYKEMVKWSAKRCGFSESLLWIPIGSVGWL